MAKLVPACKKCHSEMMGTKGKQEWREELDEGGMMHFRRTEATFPCGRPSFKPVPSEIEATAPA